MEITLALYSVSHKAILNLYQICLAGYDSSGVYELVWLLVKSTLEYFIFVFKDKVNLHVVLENIMKQFTSSN